MFSRESLPGISPVFISLKKFSSQVLARALTCNQTCPVVKRITKSLLG